MHEDGAHYRVVGVHPGPAPAHRVEIWIGALGPRMLELTGRAGDGWLPSMSYVPPDTLADRNAIIDDAAVAAGRAPSDIRRLYNIGPDASADQLADLALTHGMSTFILGSDDPREIQRFGAETAPAVRDLVDAGRTGARPVSSAGAVVAAAFAVRPTPDDGSRRSDVAAWDESTRPGYVPPDPDRQYTAHEQASAQHLVDVHDHLRAELEQVQHLIEQVATGSVDVGTARSLINTMTMRQNNWTLGAYCESYCRVVTTHHTIEDRSVFPVPASRDDALAR